MRKTILVLCVGVGMAGMVSAAEFVGATIKPTEEPSYIHFSTAAPSAYIAVWLGERGGLAFNSGRKEAGILRPVGDHMEFTGDKAATLKVLSDMIDAAKKVAP